MLPFFKLIYFLWILFCIGAHLKPGQSFEPNVEDGHIIHISQVRIPSLLDHTLESKFAKKNGTPKKLLSGE